jgi:auxin efflux carrier family
MALQERIVACGASLTALGMVLRFVAGPAATAAAAAALGLRGDVLRATIIQVRLLHEAAATHGINLNDL